MTDLTKKLVLTPELLKSFRTELQADPVSRLAANACFKNDPLEICVRRDKLYETNHVFTHKVEEAKPMTNQKSSGRCWIFACLNSMRLPFMKSFNIDEFEFSQAYVFYWDKIERCNFFLNTIADLLAQGEEVEGRLISYLLIDPCCDGGQWDMVINLINKYGVVPKKIFPESYSAENTMRLNRILKSKLREYTRDLNVAITKEKEEGTSPSKIVDLITQQMKEVYRIVSICLGVPPCTFMWEYCDKSKLYHKVGAFSPREFYENHVKPVYNVEEKICLVNDPRPSNPYGRLYTVAFLGNMTLGREVIYNNQSVETLLDLTVDSIKAGEAVWFGCEVSKRFAGKLGLHDIDIHDYKSLFGVEVNLGMSKAERLVYGESLMTHAMCFTGVSLDQTGKAFKLRVENSWGEERGEKGYHIMTVAWFKEFVFEVVIDKKYISKSVSDVPQDVKVLPAWDPMGALAKNLQG